MYMFNFILLNAALISELSTFNQSRSDLKPPRRGCRSSGRGSPPTNKTVHADNGNVRELRIFHQNVVGTLNIGNKQMEIEAILKKYTCDILFISEAAATEVTSMRISGYEAYAGYLGGHPNARVSALVRNTLKVKVTHVEAEVPNIVIDVDNEGTLYRCTSVYREWSYGGEFALRNTKTQEERWYLFADEWHKMNRRVKRSILIGDLNIDYDRSGRRLQAYQEPLRQSLREDFEEHGWQQLVRSPTRYQGDKSSLLDHIYCNIPNRVAYVINKSASTSDHNLVGVVIKVKNHFERDRQILVRNYNKIDWDRMREQATFGGLYEIFQYTHPDDILAFLEWKIIGWLDDQAPQRWVKVKSGAGKWRSKLLDQLAEERRQLHKTWTKDRTRENLQALKAKKKEVRKQERHDKWTYINDALQSSDVHRSWKMVKEVTAMVSVAGPPSSLVEDGIEVTDPRDIANLANEGFRRKVDTIVAGLDIDVAAAMEMLEEHLGGKVFEDKFKIREVDVYEVRRAITSLRNTPSVGTDGIPTRVLKELKWQLSPYIAYLVNQILRTKIYPKRWGEGVVCPIHKKGPRNIKENFRPVTVLNSSSKIFERLLNDQITEYVEAEHILSDDQHAYRAKRGTNTYWMDLMAKIADMRNRGLKVALLAFDLSSAFNVIDHDVLMKKLARVGFHEESLTMLRAFLKNRKVFTKIQDEFSDPATVNIGTPEGGICSPQLFSLAVQDYPMVAGRIVRNMKEKLRAGMSLLLHSTMRAHVVEVETEAYADDSICIIGLRVDRGDWTRMQQAINESYSVVSKYFAANGLKLNGSKTELMIIGKSDKEPLLKVEEAGIVEQKIIKLLGAKMDNNLSFMPQAIEVTKQVTNRLFNLKMLKQWATEDLMKRTAASVLLSRLYYLLESTAGEPKVMDKLQKSQNAVARVVLGGTMMTNTGGMLQRLGWLNLENQARLQSCYWVRRAHVEKVAPFFADMMAVNVNNYYTRRKGLVLPYVPKTQVLERKLLFRGTKEYNKLQLQCAPADDMYDFKETVTGKLRVRYHNHGVAGTHLGRE